MINYDDLRRLYDIKVMANMGRKNWCVCPLPAHAHHNYTPSFSVYWYQGVQYFKCHGNCGAYGDAIDFTGFMQIPNYDKVRDRVQAASQLGRGVVVSPPSPPPSPKPMNNSRWLDYQPISDAVKKYALSRGITEKQIEEFKLGSDENWLAIPTFHGPNLMGIKLRNIYDGLRYMSVTGSKKGLWGYNDVVNSDQTVYVCKGEIAAIVMRKYGFLSCAPTGGEGATVDREPLVFAKIIVVGDNDEPKVAKQTRAQAEKRARDLHGKLIFPPPEFHDIDRWLLNDPHAAHKLRSISE